MSKYIVAATRGEGVYLLTDDNGETGRVLNLTLSEKPFYPRFNFQSILMRGYWEEYKGDLKAEDLIKDAVDLEKERKEENE